MISGTAFHISTDTALCRAGLLNCIQPIGPSFWAIIRSVLVFIGSSCFPACNFAMIETRPSSNDLPGAKGGDRLVVIAVFFQDFIGMFALFGRRTYHLARGAAEFYRLIDAGDIAKRALSH